MKPKRTILCVDDNERSLSIRKVLLQTRGYRVLTCSDPECAIDILKAGGVDLVLTATESSDGYTGTVPAQVAATAKPADVWARQDAPSGFSLRATCGTSSAAKSSK